MLVSKLHYPHTNVFYPHRWVRWVSECVFFFWWMHLPDEFCTRCSVAPSLKSILCECERERFNRNYVSKRSKFFVFICTFMQKWLLILCRWLMSPTAMAAAWLGNWLCRFVVENWLSPPVYVIDSFTAISYDKQIGFGFYIITYHRRGKIGLFAWFIVEIIHFCSLFACIMIAYTEIVALLRMVAFTRFFVRFEFDFYRFARDLILNADNSRAQNILHECWFHSIVSTHFAFEFQFCVCFRLCLYINAFSWLTMCVCMCECVCGCIGFVLKTFNSDFYYSNVVTLRQPLLQLIFATMYAFSTVLSEIFRSSHSKSVAQRTMRWRRRE